MSVSLQECGVAAEIRPGCCWLWKCPYPCVCVVFLGPPAVVRKVWVGAEGGAGWLRTVLLCRWVPGSLLGHSHGGDGAVSVSLSHPDAEAQRLP